MRYVYLPKLLNDLENLEQYSKAVSNTLSNILSKIFPDDLPDGLLDNFHIDNISVEQALENHHYKYVYDTDLLFLAFEDDYTSWCVAPQSSDDTRRYAEKYDTVFYVYGSPYTRLSVQTIFEFAISLLEEACRKALTSLALHPALNTMGRSLSDKTGGVTLAVLKHLVKNYDSEEAFRNDILKAYPFALSDSPFAFTAINNNLDNIDELAKKIYTIPAQYNGWCVYGVEAFVGKLLNVLTEIDFWVDSADYDQLVAYEYLLHDDFTRGNKQVNSIDEKQKTHIFNYRSRIRKRIIKAKQMCSQGHTIPVRLNELVLEGVKPENIKLRLQW